MRSGRCSSQGSYTTSATVASASIPSPRNGAVTSARGLSAIAAECTCVADSRVRSALHCERMADRVCIVGVGSHTWRGLDAPEPLDMWTEVVDAALADAAASGDLRGAVDALEV